MTLLHIDLCCGIGGWQAPFEEASNWHTIGMDIREGLSPDIVGDVRQPPLTACEPTLVTASPPCTQFSRFDMPWYSDVDPDLALVEACLDTIEYLAPEWWVLENVRGLHRVWQPATNWSGPWYLWGDYPPLDLPTGLPTKDTHSGEMADRRAKVPFALADSLRYAVETWG